MVCILHFDALPLGIRERLIGPAHTFAVGKPCQVVNRDHGRPDRPRADALVLRIVLLYSNESLNPGKGSRVKTFVERVIWIESRELFRDSRFAGPDEHTDQFYPLPGLAYRIGIDSLAKCLFVAHHKVNGIKLCESAPNGANCA